MPLECPAFTQKETGDFADRRQVLSFSHLSNALTGDTLATRGSASADPLGSSRFRAAIMYHRRRGLSGQGLGTQRIGSRRMRTVPSPSTTMLPATRSSSTAGRFATTRSTSCSTRRPWLRRTKMSDGDDALVRARMVPKSAAGRDGREVEIDEELHAGRVRGSSRSRLVGRLLQPRSLARKTRGWPPRATSGRRPVPSSECPAR